MAAAAILTATSGIVWINSTGPTASGRGGRILLVTDQGVRLSSFFAGLTGVDQRLRPRTNGEKALARIEDSSFFHFLGLSPSGVHAQDYDCGTPTVLKFSRGALMVAARYTTPEEPVRIRAPAPRIRRSRV